MIFDEPTASLDGATGRKIIGFIKENFLNEHRCILIVTHDAGSSNIADRNLEMEDGRIVKIVSGSKGVGGVSESKILTALVILGIVAGLVSAYVYGIRKPPLPPAFNPAPRILMPKVFMPTASLKATSRNGANINIYPEVREPSPRYW